MARERTSRVLRVLDHEFSAAVGLVIGVGVALVWSSTSTSYFSVLASTWHARLFTTLEVNSLHNIVINALMAVFFFALGLELAREFSSGALNRSGRVAPALFGAVGGMLATASGSLVVGHLVHSTALVRGWGVPMATDVAFTLGVLAVVGRRLPPALRVFLLTLAICDDVLSVVVLSVSGTTHLRVLGLVSIVAASGLGLLATRRATSDAAAVATLLVLWLSFTWANVEPALAGVLAGAIVTTTSTPRHDLERAATRVSVGVVLPLFALVACGLRWSDVRWSGPVGTVIVATIVLRLAGKTLGITGGVYLAHFFHYRLDASITWAMLATTSLLCAIGFTVPLLFATALFGAQSALYSGFTLGLLLSSIVAAVVGGAILHRLSRRE